MLPTTVLPTTSDAAEQGIVEGMAVGASGVLAGRVPLTRPASPASTQPASTQPTGTAGQPSSVETRWFAMGAEAHMVIVAAPSIQRALADQARALVATLEQRWSRFIADSEISRLNMSAGAPMRCHPTTVRLVTEMVEGWWATDGAFDPTLLAALVASGYGTSRSDPGRSTSPAPHWAMSGQPNQVLVDQQHNTVQLPLGTTLDPGGIGKGLAADLVIAALMDSGAEGALVSLGGDLAVAGRSPRGDSWVIDVAPHDGIPPMLIRLSAGGVATSSARKRTWNCDVDTRHHLLHPGTGRSTTSEVVGATVVAGSAATAEVFTKCAFVDDIDAAIERYDTFGLAAHVWAEIAPASANTDGRSRVTQHPSRAWSDFVALPATSQPLERTPQ